MTLPLIGPPIPPGDGKTFSLIGAWPSWQSTSLAVNGKSVPCVPFAQLRKSKGLSGRSSADRCQRSCP